MSVAQWTGSRSLADTRSFLVLSEKPEADQATHTFAVRAGMSDRFSTRGTNSNLLFLGVNDVSGVQTWLTLCRSLFVAGGFGTVLATLPRCGCRFGWRRRERETRRFSTDVPYPFATSSWLGGASVPP